MGGKKSAISQEGLHSINKMGGGGEKFGDYIFNLPEQGRKGVGRVNPPDKKGRFGKRLPVFGNARKKIPREKVFFSFERKEGAIEGRYLGRRKGKRGGK